MNGQNLLFFRFVAVEITNSQLGTFLRPFLNPEFILPYNIRQNIPFEALVSMKIKYLRFLFSTLFYDFITERCI